MKIHRSADPIRPAKTKSISRLHYFSAFPRRTSNFRSILWVPPTASVRCYKDGLHDEVDVITVLQNQHQKETHHYCPTIRDHGEYDDTPRWCPMPQILKYILDGKGWNQHHPTNQLQNKPIKGQYRIVYTIIFFK